MPLRFRTSLLAALSLAAAPAHAQPAAPDALQALVVTTEDWDSTAAVVRRFARATPAAPWREVGPSLRAAVGRSGLGWGDGLHPDAESATGPAKREGDGRAPAGVFRLSSAFGYASAAESRWIRLPYHASDASIECVDDAASAYYNRRVDRDAVARVDWTSHEEMRRNDGLYRLGVWVDHNSSPPTAGRGSCIFLHIWAAPGAPTSGCTAFADADLELILRWLDPRSGPVLVQLPEAEYRRLRLDWRLP
ncbi:MAG TPA: L,D-transpeptidase family protein [Longimicrobium sp.]|jgi:D-alanyl-D-alanine dipeptidase